MHTKFDDFLNENSEYFAIDDPNMTNDIYNALTFPMEQFNKFGAGTMNDPIKLKFNTNVQVTKETNDSFYFFINSVLAAKKNQKYIMKVNRHADDIRYHRSYKYPKLELGRTSVYDFKSLSAFKASPILFDWFSWFGTRKAPETFRYFNDKFKLSESDFAKILSNKSQPLILTTETDSIFEYMQLAPEFNIDFKYVVVS
jgi:hypothetical protein